MKSFRDWGESIDEDDGYEPQPLWLIPILLRTRIQYYREVVDKTKKQVEEAWRRWGKGRIGWSEFDKTDTVEQIWNQNSPLWWGLNDVIGFIEVHLCIRDLDIRAALFLTAKKPSRRLVRKNFVISDHKRVPLIDGATNGDLQNATLAAIKELASDPKLRKRHVDLRAWERSVRHTDLIGMALAFRKDWQELDSTNQ